MLVIPKFNTYLSVVLAHQFFAKFFSSSSIVIHAIIKTSHLVWVTKVF